MHTSTHHNADGSNTYVLPHPHSQHGQIDDDETRRRRKADYRTIIDDQAKLTAKLAQQTSHRTPSHIPLRDNDPSFVDNDGVPPLE